MRSLACLAMLCALCVASQALAQAPPVGDKPPPDQLLIHADAIATQVANIRGLALLRPLERGVRDRAQLRALLLERLAEDYSDADFSAEEAVFKRLAMLPPESDYKSLLIELLTEQIAGFYDPQAHALFIMQGLPLELQRPTLAHELFHAIQDQHFNILAMREPFSALEHADFHIARTALLEGDATVLMIDFSLYESGSLPSKNARSVVDSPMMAQALSRLAASDLNAMESLLGASPSANPTDSAMSRAPQVIRELLMFPYLGGLRFVMLARQGRSWGEFDAMLYKQPPVSTEQIMHPERYFAGDEPLVLSFNAGQGDAPLLYDNVMGELQLLLMLRAQHEVGGGEAIDAARAATGWDGDRVIAWRDPHGELQLVMVSAWDSPRDAREFFDALSALTQRRYKRQQPLLSASSAAAGHGQALALTLPQPDGQVRRVYVERWGDLVLYIDGPRHGALPPERERESPLYAMRDTIWSSLKRAPLREVMRQRAAAKAAPAKP